MNRTSLFALVAVAGFAACGDNSKQCGPNTTDVDGVCTGTGGTDVCSDGTKLDPDTGKCVIDPDACQDGTVLVGGECVDPGHVTADLTEGAEPNGLGLFGEDSTGPAGTIMLKPIGQHFVINGKIIPFQDLDGDGQQDPDIDTYIVDVTGPAMLSVTADGLHGLAAGFLSIADVDQSDPLATWQRFGVNLSGDMSKRQLYLPAAGTYAIAIADSRTLFLSGGAAVAPDGAPALEYYVTIDAIDATPTPLTVTGGSATSSGTLNPGEVKLFTVPMGAGINSASFDAQAPQITESLVITNSRAGAITVKAVADVDPNTGDPPSASFLGIKSGDTTLVVADSFVNYANQPTGYTLDVTVGDAGALSTTGTDVSQPSSATDFSAFYYDVASANEITGMDISFDRPLSGVIVDQDFFIFSFFTFDPSFGFQFGDTFQDYKGLLRHPTAGRYYFLVFDPAGDPADITATSRYAPVPAVAITEGTPLAGQAMTSFESNPFTYNAGTTDAWQQFAATGTGTGAMTAAYFDPNTAYGHLDTLNSTCGSFCDDTAPLFSQTLAAAGTPVGRILLDDTTTNYLLTINTATVTGTPTFDLDFKRRPHTALGPVAVGTPVNANDQPLDPTTNIQRYLIKMADTADTLTVTAHPDQGTLDTRIQQVSNTETSIGALVNNGIAGADDTKTNISAGTGWVAVVITPTAAVVGQTFDLTATAVAPPYLKAAGATTYADACAGGTVVTMQDADEGMSTATINAPAGFQLFGAAATSFNVNANGFLTFDTALACASVGGSCFFSNATTIPSAANPNGFIAPYWDDIVTSSVCQKTAGTKLIIQWEGELFSDASPVAFQAILDGANSTIELVYSGTQTPTGASGTVGLENSGGSVGFKVGINTAGTITPGTSILLTPN